MTFVPKPANQPNYLDRTRFTLQEYLAAIKKPIQHPDPEDSNDPGYYKKYAHNLPPLEAHFLVLDNADRVNTEDDSNNRKVFWAWNNLTDFEKQML